MAISEYANELLVIYEGKAEDWAIYMKDLLGSILKEDEILLYNLDIASDEMMEYLILPNYRCKLLVLTSNLLENLNEKLSIYLAQLLSPSHSVVILLCGVNTLDGFYELVPTNRDSQVIFTDQDPQNYISVIFGVINEGHQDINISTSLNTSIEDAIWESREDTEIPILQRPSVLVLPQRIQCENPGEIFILLNDEIPTNAAIEIEFCTENEFIRKQPEQWNEKVLCLKALDFPAGPVTVNVCCGEVITATTEIEYYTATGEIELLLKKVADPIAFICQAFNVYSLEELDFVLAKSLQSKMSSCEFNLHEINQHTDNTNSDELPTLLHCAAKFGLKEVTLLLTKCPGAVQASTMMNKYGEDPATIAEKHGHKDIQKIIHQLNHKAETKEYNEVQEEEYEHEEMYVRMESYVVQQCTQESYENGQEAKEDPSEGTKEDEHLIVDSKEEKMQNLDDTDSYEDLEENVYCFPIPSDTPSVPSRNEDLHHVFQDEKYHKDEKKNWGGIDQYSEEEKNESESKEGEHLDNSFSAVENLYVDLLFDTAEEGMQKEQKSFIANIPQSTDLPLDPIHTMKDRSISNMDQAERREESNLEKMLWYEHDEYCVSEEDHEEDHEEEDPYSFASIEDSLYMVLPFETADNETQRGKKSFIVHRAPAPAPRPGPSVPVKEDGGASFISQGCQLSPVKVAYFPILKQPVLMFSCNIVATI
ncbi:B-cell scaffold protein with ankyrin repeats isoform X2 [Ascaphus truei]|uniref:B-cell scaffold protein with ankyrin repeats isoform X2 n=1 Tax=Ascaphus truei TaxID=8439 RepID=UPI003F59D710